jgi:hypothetical protein
MYVLRQILDTYLLVIWQVKILCDKQICRATSKYVMEYVKLLCDKQICLSTSKYVVQQANMDVEGQANTYVMPDCRITISETFPNFVIQPFWVALLWVKRPTGHTKKLRPYLCTTYLYRHWMWLKVADYESNIYFLLYLVVYPIM